MNDDNKNTATTDQKPIVEAAKTEDAAKTEEVKTEAAK